MATLCVRAILEMNNFIFKDQFLTRLKSGAKGLQIDVLIEVPKGEGDENLGKNCTRFCFRIADGLPREQQDKLDNLINSLQDDIIKHVHRYQKQRMNSLNLQTPA